MAAQSPSSAGEESPGAKPTGADSHPPTDVTGDTTEPDEHFRPIGTVFILGAFVLVLILLWLSVYVILISRGVTT